MPAFDYDRVFERELKRILASDKISDVNKTAFERFLKFYHVRSSTRSMMAHTMYHFLQYFGVR